MKELREAASAGAMEESLAAVTARVAEYTIGLDAKRLENHEKAVIANGLIALGQDKYVKVAHQIARHAMKTQNSDGQLGFGPIVPGDPARAVEKWTGAGTITGTVHSSTLGPAVLHFYRLLGEEEYLAAARRQYGYLQSVPRTKDGGIIHREEAKELWADSIWFICPFLAQYGAVTGDAGATDEAVRQIRVHTERLRDVRSGLFRHIWCETPNYYPQTMFWSRGHGWIAAGLVDTYGFLPKGHSGRGEISEILDTMARALLGLQDASGFWHNILDDRHSPLESSGTLMFAYALRKALDDGILNDKHYAEAARRAMEAAKGMVYNDGSVGLVTLPPGGPGARIGTAPYGQGWFLHAASRFLGTP
jgi:unsaturated rhamnogalacturonyl hydrolase